MVVFFKLSNDQQGRTISAENVVGSGSDTELYASRTTAATSMLQVTSERSKKKIDTKCCQSQRPDDQPRNIWKIRRAARRTCDLRYYTAFRNTSRTAKC